MEICTQQLVSHSSRGWWEGCYATYLSPSAGTTSSILSFWLISSIRRWSVYASSCSLVILAMMAVGSPMSPAALFSVASPQRFLFLRRLDPSPAGSSLAVRMLVYGWSSIEATERLPLVGLRPRLKEGASEWPLPAGCEGL